MSPAADVEDLSRMAGNGVQVVAQTGEGLGPALTSVFAHFATAGRRRIVAFNSDSPHLPASALRLAFDALRSCDLVVGPTHDGGYYLVGGTASHPGLFASSAMGTTSALQALLARAQVLGLSVRSIDPFYDIDVPADLSRLAEELRLAPERAPRTARWLAEWARQRRSRRRSVRTCDGHAVTPALWARRHHERSPGSLHPNSRSCRLARLPHCTGRGRHRLPSRHP